MGQQTGITLAQLSRSLHLSVSLILCLASQQYQEKVLNNLRGELNRALMRWDTQSLVKNLTCINRVKVGLSWLC